MANQTEIILIKDHVSLGRKDTVVKMLSSNVEAWVESGYAKRYKAAEKETSPKSKKKGSTK
jgi:hypothetical protein